MCDYCKPGINRLGSAFRMGRVEIDGLPDEWVEKVYNKEALGKEEGIGLSISLVNYDELPPHLEASIDTKSERMGIISTDFVTPLIPIRYCPWCRECLVK